MAACAIGTLEAQRLNRLARLGFDNARKGIPLDKMVYSSWSTDLFGRPQGDLASFSPLIGLGFQYYTRLLDNLSLYCSINISV